MCEFVKADVLKVAKAFIDNYERMGTALNNCDKIYCIYCKQETELKMYPKPIIHKLDCPVLVAQDILNRNK